MATTYSESQVPVITAGEDGGNKVGNSSTEKVGFYGKTPLARPSVTWPNTGTATTTLNETKVNRLKDALVNLGLIVTT